MAYAEDDIKELIRCLRQPPERRCEQDVEAVYNHLRCVEALCRSREQILRDICRKVRHEHYDGGTILFSRGSLCTSWYILLTGTVLINGVMYLPQNSFGTHNSGSPYRQHDCLVLDCSDFIVIDYSDSSAQRCFLNRPIRMITLDSMEHNTMMYNNHGTCPRVVSHASDTSSAYSGSDVLSAGEPDGVSLYSSDQCTLVRSDCTQEPSIDSEDEDFESETVSFRDLFQEYLHKDPNERSEDEIQTLLEGVENLPAFSVFAQPTRRTLCAAMLGVSISGPDVVVIADGERLDAWTVVLSGLLELTTAEGDHHEYSRGDSFGVQTNGEHDQCQRGDLRTRSCDCQMAIVPANVFFTAVEQEVQCRLVVEEEGRQVLVYEECTQGNKTVKVVDKGTPEKLLDHLMNDTNGKTAMGPYQVDFLLTFRCYLPSAQPLLDRLRHWHSQEILRGQAVYLLVLWMQEQWADFETHPDLTQFVDSLETLWEVEPVADSSRKLIYLACDTKARSRHVSVRIKEEYKESEGPQLPFRLESAQQQLFVSEVIDPSVGLRRGDLVLEVDGKRVDRVGIQHVSNLFASEAGTQLDIQVIHKPYLYYTYSRRAVSNVEDISSSTEDGGRFSLSLEVGSDGRSYSVASIDHVNCPLPLPAKSCRSNDSSSSDLQKKIIRSRSTNVSPNRDPNDGEQSVLPSDELGCWGDLVLRVWRSSEGGSQQTSKFLQVTTSTTVKEVIQGAAKEYGIPQDQWGSLALYQVTVNPGPVTHKSRLKENQDDLLANHKLNSRYYLQDMLTQEVLLSDDRAAEVFGESISDLLKIPAATIATYLTLDDFAIFRTIQATELVDETLSAEVRSETSSEEKFRSPTTNLDRFSDLVKRETMWAPSELCAEPNLTRRVSLLKHFIKIAKSCKDVKNFNSLFCIINGLDLYTCRQLKQTWDKLPPKYLRLYQTLKMVTNLEKNFLYYRSLLKSEESTPPMIPYMPISLKDLKFIHLGNSTRTTEGLINFGKLRLLAREVRNVCWMYSSSYDPANLGLICHYHFPGVSTDTTDCRLNTPRTQLLNSGFVTTSRGGKRPLLRRHWDEWWSGLRWRTYQSSVTVVLESEALAVMAMHVEPHVGSVKGGMGSQSLGGSNNSVNSVGRKTSVCSDSQETHQGTPPRRRRSSCNRQNSVTVEEAPPAQDLPKVKGARSLALSGSERVTPKHIPMVQLPMRAISRQNVPIQEVSVLETIPTQPGDTTLIQEETNTPAPTLPPVPKPCHPPPYRVVIGGGEQSPHTPTRSKSASRPRTPTVPTSRPPATPTVHKNRPPAPPDYHHAISRLSGQPLPPPPPPPSEDKAQPRDANNEETRTGTSINKTDQPDSSMF